MVEVKNLSKYYANQLAIKDLNFTVQEGEILGFLGPNGAGKTTTMNIMTGYISSTTGTVTIDGTEILEDPIKAKSMIGYLPEIPPLYQDMTVLEYIGFVYDLKKIKKIDSIKKSKFEHISDICTKVKIDDVYDRLIRNLSKGYKQRVGIAQALLGNPKLLILDEPTVGLDPKQIIEIRSLIKELGEDHTVILSSHVLSEVQAVCDRVIVINKGVLVADDTTENLSKKSSSEKVFTVTVEGEEENINNLYEEINNMQYTSDVLTEKEAEGSVNIIIKADKDIRREISSAVLGNNLVMLGLKAEETNLEDIFMELMEKDLESADILEESEEDVSEDIADIKAEESDQEKEELAEQTEEDEVNK